MTRNELKTKIFESIGEASMCWNPRPEGIFDSTHASKIGDSLMEAVDAAREDEAVGFAEWVDEHFTNFKQHVYISNFHDGSYGKSHISAKYFMLKDLYQLYLKRKQKQHIVDIMNDDAKDGLYKYKNEKL